MADQQKSKYSKPSFLISVAILLLLLVGLPIGSWFYLQSGLEYRQELLGQLKGHGAISGMSLQTHTGEPFTNQVIDSRIVVASVLDFSNESLKTAFGNSLMKLHDQFDERNEVAFLMHIADSTTTDETVQAFAEAYALTDARQCYFLRGAEGEYTAKELYNMPEEAVESLAYYALADTSNTVRRFYDVREEEEVKRLVEHIAIILPQRNNRRASNRDLDR